MNETTVTSLNGERSTTFSTNGSDGVSGYFARKKWPTRIVGAVLLIVAGPLILLLAVLVRCTSSGPWLFRQRRTGMHGKTFSMFKIRTMYEDAESVSGPVWCRPGDSRITPVGRMLRFLHLDELPQLINVARGEMDLIGPRPERPCFVAWLAREVPNYTDRLAVLPGVTGLAQINLPPDESLDSVGKKLVLDCHYARIASFGLDVRILMCTFLRMIGIRHGRAARWLRVRYHVEPPDEEQLDTAQAVWQWAHHVAAVHSAASLISSNGAGRVVVASVESQAENGIPPPEVQELAAPAVASPRRPR